MWWGAHAGMGWWMLIGGLWMLLFWGAIIWVAVWGIRLLVDSRRTEDGPLEIAKRRYARGEITPEEFETIRTTLAGRAA